MCGVSVCVCVRESVSVSVCVFTRVSSRLALVGGVNRISPRTLLCMTTASELGLRRLSAQASLQTDLSVIFTIMKGILHRTLVLQSLPRGQKQ